MKGHVLSTTLSAMASLWLLSTVAARTKGVAVSRDYCLSESLNVTCAAGSVVLLQSALYGRMRRGRCISGEGPMDCSTDVLAVVDRKCSGRRACVVSVRNLVDVQTPCHSDFAAYLEASYTCVRLSPAAADCSSADQCRVTGVSGFLSLSLADTARVGTEACPWVVAVPPGQRVSFAAYELTGAWASGRRVDRCRTALVFGEGEQTTVRSLCRLQSRLNQVFTSVGSSVTVFITGPRATRAAAVRHLVHYEATGCADLVMPADSWATRDGDKLTVHCNSSMETRHIVCDGNTWIGRMANCTTQRSTSSAPTVPRGLLMAILIGIILGVSIGTAMLAFIYCIQRSKCCRRKEAGVVLYTEAADHHHQVDHCKLTTLNCHGCRQSQRAARADTLIGEPPADSGSNPSLCSAQLGRSLPLWPACGVPPSSAAKHVYESPIYPRDASRRPGAGSYELADKATRHCAVHS